MPELNSVPVGFTYAYKSEPSTDTTKAIDPKLDEATAHNTRGIDYSENGDQDKAIVTFTKAIALKPNFAEAYNNRGVAHGIQNDYEYAIADFTKTIALKPNDAIAYHNRGGLITS